MRALFPSVLIPLFRSFILIHTTGIGSEEPCMNVLIPLFRSFILIHKVNAASAAVSSGLNPFVQVFYSNRGCRV